MKMGRRRGSGAAGGARRVGLAGWLRLAGWLGRAGLAGWAGKKWRGMRPDGNPLRRRWDRVEAFIFGGLLIAAAVAAPVAAMAGGHWAYTSAQQAARLQRETSYRVPAELLAVPDTKPNGYSVTTTVTARAQWTAPAGRTRTGEIPVLADSVKGYVVTIWTDQAGDLVNPPMTPAQVAEQGTFGTVAGVVLTVVTLLVAAGITRLVVNRRRMAAWDADWAVTAPMWTRQR
ncbi:MAG: hypothetical protein JWM19_4880 [Actinomycetia bacterium]|nr:hypothetical protein [Actinomycetes bacterium]